MNHWKILKGYIIPLLLMLLTMGLSQLIKKD
jgi:hypothetical protein